MSRRWFSFFPAPFTVVLLLSFSLAGVASAETEFQKDLIKRLITATPGTVIELPEGTYELDAQLSLMVDQVTIKGKGMDKTILTFKDQKVGAEGLAITSNGVVLEDFTIQDTKGDAIKISNSDGVTIRRVKTEWTGGPKTENGAYGFYPVQCNNVLIEDSQVFGASDAGVYVGQSTNIIVRRNYAAYNVAGIEIENSVDADVYDNTVTKNTGGILVFDMPDIELKGKNVRVFNNKIFDNNTINFAPAKNTVADVPTGTGIMITANKHVEVFRNQIDNHRTANFLIVSYLVTGRPIKDEKYDPFPEAIYIYDNQVGTGGHDPLGGSSEDTQTLIEILRQLINVPFPDVVFDGSFDEKKLVNGKIPEELRVCVQNNGDADFINLDALREFQGMSRDLALFDCAHPKLPAVVLPGQK